MAATLRILHLSDLHARGVDGPQAERARREAARRKRVLGERWRDNLAELGGDGRPFDLVVFTGDLADWGHGTDYAPGAAFLRDTCAQLRVPIDRLFVVPGNHDVDRTIEPEVWSELRAIAATEPRRFSEWMAGGKPPRGVVADGRERVLARTGAFWRAVDEQLGRGELLPARSPHRALGFRRTVAVDGAARPVQVIGLDSGWMAGSDHDEGHLWITEDQVNLLCRDEQGDPLPGFRLALIHHPLSAIAGGDPATRLLRDDVDLLLRGHQHTPASSTAVDPDGRLHELAAGCLYEGDDGNRHPNGCHVIDVALTDAGRPRRIDVRFRAWSADGSFWTDHSLLYRHAPNGRLTIDLAGEGGLAALREAIDEYRAWPSEEGNDWRQRTRIDQRLLLERVRPSLAELDALLANSSDRETQMAVAVVLGLPRAGEADAAVGRLWRRLLASPYDHVRYRSAESITHRARTGIAPEVAADVAAAVRAALAHEESEPTCDVLTTALRALPGT